MEKLTLPKFHWAKILSVLFFILLLGAYANIFAIGQKYIPGETLDPSCPPGEVNCTVDIGTGGTMIYPSSGIPISNGTAWTTSIIDNSTNWNTAYGWGNHATAGYVTGTPWTSQGYITDGNTGWDNSYGFITSYTETDPIFLSSTAHSITGTDITNWNAKQAALISGNNIKTINGASVLGSGNLTVSGSQWITTGNDIYYNDGNVGIGTMTPNAKLGIKFSTTFSYNKSFSGSGLDDATFSGSYNGVISTNQIYLSIDNEGTSDTFTYYDDNGDCSGSNISITGSAQLLCDGISITFASITGHTAYDQWNYSMNRSINDNNPLLNITDGTSNYFTVWENSVNLFGKNAGYQTSGLSNANFFGENAGYQDYDVSDSNFFGYNAGYHAYSSVDSNFLGNSAGKDADGANDSNFFGLESGLGATDAESSNFFGWWSGRYATSASNSNFFGFRSGESAISSSDSNFFGADSGRNADNASDSNFFGLYAGASADNSSNSNFFGNNAGSGAYNSSNSNFFGNNAGAANASYSNFFGFRAGMFYPGNNIGSNNIIIGTNISLPNATANAMNLGGVLFASGTYATTTGNPSITAVTSGKVGIAVVSPSYTLQVGNNTISGIVARFQNSTGTCDINPTTSTLSCSSDINLKKNITDLDNIEYNLKTIDTTDLSTLEKVLSLTPVTYNWKSENDTDSKHIGFIAQEMEQIFPNLVSTDPDTGLKSIGYANMTPYLVKAIQEMDLKVKDMSSLDTSNATSLGYLIKSYLADFSNSLEIVFFGEVHTKKLCLDDLCIDKAQLEKLLKNSETMSSTTDTTVSNTDTDVSTPDQKTKDETDLIIENPIVDVPVDIPAVVTPEIPSLDVNTEASAN